MVLYEHAREGAYFKRCAFDGFIHTVELLKVLTHRICGGRLFLMATTQQRVEDLGFVLVSILTVKKAKKKEALRVNIDWYCLIQCIIGTVGGLLA